MFALLIDPDKVNETLLQRKLAVVESAKIDFIFVGGSLASSLNISRLIRQIKEHTEAPVVLFPGNVSQLSPEADALLFLSLISGRNPEFLIGHHVAAAPMLRQMDLEVIPTGYLLIDSGKQTSAGYMSGTQPIPYDKPDIAKYTALAGQYLGHKLVYLDGGSGADKPVSRAMITAVSKTIDAPLIVGGGLRSAESVRNALDAGSDLIVVGNSLETDDDNRLLFEIAETVNAFAPVAK